MLRVFFLEPIKHQIHIVLKFLIVLTDFTGIDKLNQRCEVLLIFGGFIIDIGDKGGVEQCFCFHPKIIAYLTLAFGVGNQGSNEL